MRKIFPRIVGRPARRKPGGNHSGHPAIARGAQFRTADPRVQCGADSLALEHGELLVRNSGFQIELVARQEECGRRPRQ